MTRTFKLTCKEEEELVQAVIDGSIKKNHERELVWRDLVLIDSDFQALETRVVRDDFEAFCRRWYWIVHKINRNPVLFLFNNIQQKYHREKTRFDIILKYRKGGITTYKCAEYFHKTIFFENTKTVILTHHRASTDEIFLEFVKKPYERLPHFLKPEKKYDSKHELSFPGPGSSYRVGTASSRGFGAGTTPDNVHLSEAARYEHLSQVMGDLNQAVFVGNPRAHISIESVANGENEFFQEWVLAKEARSRFKPHFFPWFIDETNVIQKKPGEVTRLSREEKEAVGLYGLSGEQIKFRRMKDQECREGGAAPRRQEYPETDLEAFVTSGHKRFDAVDLDLWYRQVTARKIAYLTSLPDWNGCRYLPVLLNQGLRIYKPPQPGKRYVIGSDIAQGKSDQGDFSDAVVMEYETCEEVAELHGRFEPDMWAIYLYELGTLYNTALLAPEVNNDMGGVVITHLVHGIMIRGEVVYPCAYPNLYMFRFMGTATKRWTYGWHTNHASKILMINELGNYLQNRSIGVNFPEFLGECRMFQLKRDGSVGAPDASGCYDDRVISRAIALQARKQARPPQRPNIDGLVAW